MIKPGHLPKAQSYLFYREARRTQFEIARLRAQVRQLCNAQTGGINATSEIRPTVDIHDIGSWVPDDIKELVLKHWDNVVELPLTSTHLGTKRIGTGKGTYGCRAGDITKLGDILSLPQRRVFGGNLGIGATKLRQIVVALREYLSEME